jgi:hypothetical protein
MYNPGSIAEIMILKKNFPFRAMIATILKRNTGVAKIYQYFKRECLMNQCKIKVSWVLLIVAWVFLLTGASIITANAEEAFPCAKTCDIAKTIAPEASLEDFSCVVKKWKGENTLHFNVAVKNISQEDQRFKVNIFLENGKAVGGLLPRKIKKGLIKPGDTAKFTYPVKGVAKASGKIDLIIKTMSK